MIQLLLGLFKGIIFDLIGYVTFDVCDAGGDSTSPQRFEFFYSACCVTSGESRSLLSSLRFFTLSLTALVFLAT